MSQKYENEFTSFNLHEIASEYINTIRAAPFWLPQNIEFLRPMRYISISRKNYLFVEGNELTPEEDFMLGIMLGYDITQQSERYCNQKVKCRV